MAQETQYNVEHREPAPDGTTPPPKAKKPMTRRQIEQKLTHLRKQKKKYEHQSMRGGVASHMLVEMVDVDITKFETLLKETP